MSMQFVEFNQVDFENGGTTPQNRGCLARKAGPGVCYTQLPRGQPAVLGSVITPKDSCHDASPYWHPIFVKTNHERAPLLCNRNVALSQPEEERRKPPDSPI